MQHSLRDFIADCANSCARGSMLSDLCNQDSVINVVCDTTQSAARILEHDLVTIMMNHVNVGESDSCAAKLPIAIIDCSRQFQFLNVIRQVKRRSPHALCTAEALDNAVKNIHVYYPSSFADLESLSTELTRFPPIVYHRIYLCGFISSWFFEEKGKGRYGNGVEYQIPSLLQQLAQSHKCPVLLLRTITFPNNFLHYFTHKTNVELERYFSSEIVPPTMGESIDLNNTQWTDVDLSYIHTQLAELLDYRLMGLVTRHIFVHTLSSTYFSFFIFSGGLPIPDSTSTDRMVPPCRKLLCLK